MYWQAEVTCARIWHKLPAVEKREVITTLQPLPALTPTQVCQMTNLFSFFSISRSSILYDGLAAFFFPNHRLLVGFGGSTSAKMNRPYCFAFDSCKGGRRFVLLSEKDQIHTVSHLTSSMIDNYSKVVLKPQSWSSFIRCDHAC